MGWTFTHRDKGTSNRDWFAREFDSDSGKVLDAATVGGVCYLAYASTPASGAPEVRALVCLTRWIPSGDYHNFGYKQMDETMGPVATGCPQRILDLLSPPEHLDCSAEGREYARQWRAAAADALAARRARGTVSRGTRVRFAQPIRFSDGVSADTFEWITGSTFCRLHDGQAGSRVRITNWRDKSWSRA